MTVLKFLKHLMDKVLEIGSVLSLTIMISVVTIQVFSRFALPKTPHWTEEATRILFIYMVSFAGGLAVRDDAFVNVDTFTNYLPPKLKRLLQLGIQLIVIAFMAIIATQAVTFVKVGAMQRSPALLVPMSYVFAGTLVVSVFIGIYSCINFFQSVYRFVRGQE